MSASDLDVTIGVEEEFFLVDPETRDLVSDPGPGHLRGVRTEPRPAPGGAGRCCGPRSRPTRGSARRWRRCAEALRETRRLVIESAARHGVAVMAASSHPFADWRTQLVTARERYERFAVTFQESIRRLLVGAMHVHGGFGDPDSRIRVMTAIRRYLPLVHALSTSSPFHAGRETGFKSYRLSIMGALPRTSLPGPLVSVADYDRVVRAYQRMKFIEDSSELWWDVRPFPSLSDGGDAYLRCLPAPRRRGEHRGRSTPAWSGACCSCITEDCCHPIRPRRSSPRTGGSAQRYGVLAFLGDVRGSGGRVDIEDYAARVVEELAGDAHDLGCEQELRHVLIIIRDGSSADRQLDHFRLRRLEGDTEEEALRAVVDLVVAETREGIDAAG